MSKMSELDLCITEISNGDEPLRQSMIEEINDHLNGTMAWNLMSQESQMAYEMFESNMSVEHAPVYSYLLTLVLIVLVVFTGGNANAYPHNHSAHSHSHSIKIPKSWS